MKLLIVAMADSIHTMRWISQISDQQWDIYLFPTNSFTSVHPGMPPVRIYKPELIDFLIKRFKDRKKSRGSDDHALMGNVEMFSRGEIIKRFLPDRRVSRLSGLIKKIKPDLIHSMHIQESGYLVLEAKKRLADNFPGWLVTNWGSELNLFSKISFHKDKIKEVLLNCDYLSGECNSDIKIARELGFNGRFLPVIPNSGGIDFEHIDKIKKKTPTSDRKNIMLKGYQNWAGRSLVGLRALERCEDVLKGYRILVYNANTVDVIVAVELFSEKTGIEVDIIPAGTPHSEILAHHGSARISIGLSITDAISTSLLEAMVMGSFPIQSNTSCAGEWFKDGKTGMLVEPEDPEDVEQAIRKALADDELVNNAAVLNYNVLEERLEYSMVKKKVIDNYKSLVRD